MLDKFLQSIEEWHLLLAWAQVGICFFIFERKVILDTYKRHLLIKLSVEKGVPREIIQHHIFKSSWQTVRTFIPIILKYIAVIYIPYFILKFRFAAVDDYPWVDLALIGTVALFVFAHEYYTRKAARAALEESGLDE